MTINPNLNEILASTHRVTCEVAHGEEEPEREPCQFAPNDDERTVVATHANVPIILSRKDLEAPQWGNSRTFYYSENLTFTFWG